MRNQILKKKTCKRNTQTVNRGPAVRIHGLHPQRDRKKSYVSKYRYHTADGGNEIVPSLQLVVFLFQNFKSFPKL